MSLYQVSFRASYSAPGELSATTMKPKQKRDFGALGDTYPEMENSKNETTTVHSYNLRTPLKSTCTATSASPNRHDRQHGQRVSGGEMENSKNETAALTTPAHHSSPRAPPHPHLRKSTAGRMTNVPPAAFAAHIYYQILSYYTTNLRFSC